jgi:hypothetical protein
MIAVAAVHVATKRMGNFSMAGVVGSIDDEFAIWYTGVCTIDANRISARCRSA